MSESRLTNDDFFLRLGELFNSCRTSEHGSVCLTQKRLTPHDIPTQAPDASLPFTSPFPDLHLQHPLPILVRATNAKSKESKTKKIKLSTVVQPDDLDAFFTRYADACKAGMSGLKKRDRSGRKAKEKKRKKEKKEAEKK